MITNQVTKEVFYDKDYKIRLQLPNQPTISVEELFKEAFRDIGLVMIVKCNALYNKNISEYMEFDSQLNLVVDNHYNVLEIMLNESGISYRINSDRFGLNSCSVIVLAKDFEIITNTIPENWILDKEFSCLSPQKWNEINLWEESFWQDYIENKPKAVQCYREEIKTIVAADKDYIPTMIKERLDRNKFRSWQDSMLPLFEEIMEGQ